MQNKSKHLDVDIKMIQRAHMFNHAISKVERREGPMNISKGYLEAFMNCYQKGWRN